MSYTQAITRQHRTACFLLLDLSGSMRELIDHNGHRVQKCEVVVNAVNKIIRELYMRAMRNNEVRDYYDIAVVGYSSERVFSLLGGDLDDPFVSITKMGVDFKCKTPLSIDSDDSSTIEVISEGSTPMYEALYYTYNAMRNWCAREENKDSFPPMIWNITDGHPTDCDLDSIVEIAKRIKATSTNDGEVLLINIHLEDGEHTLRTIFPTDEEVASHHDAYVRMLGYASSTIPGSFEPLANELREVRKSGGYRGMGCSLSVTDMISMLTIGTLSRAMK